MTDFDALLDEAQYPYSDIEICLAGEFQAERDRLIHESGQIDESDLRLGQKSRIVEIAEQIKALQEKIGDRMVTIRVYRVPGDEWNALKLKHPVTKTPGMYDKVMGFNSEAVCKLALLEHGKLLQRTFDEEGALLDESEQPITAGQWSKLFAKASGGDIKFLFDRIVGQNELNNRAEVDRLSKGSRRTSGSDQK